MWANSLIFKQKCPKQTIDQWAKIRPIWSPWSRAEVRLGEVSWAWMKAAKKVFDKASLSHCQPIHLKGLWCRHRLGSRVARFILICTTYQNGKKLKKWPQNIGTKGPQNKPNGHKIYQHLLLKDPKKITLISNFGFLISHLATLLGSCFQWVCSLNVIVTVCMSYIHSVKAKTSAISNLQFLSHWTREFHLTQPTFLNHIWNNGLASHQIDSRLAVSRT
jgi:hypothetical protein